MNKLLVFIAMLLAYSSASLAQNNYNDDDNEDDPYDTKSYFMFGLNYLSNNVYLGRKDTVVIPYSSPYIGYHFANGLYAKALASFTRVKGSHEDLTTVEAGYDHSFGNHFSAGINADKYYYNKNSLSIRSATQGIAGVNGQYSNDWVEPQVTFDLNFNKKSTDYVLGLQLDHDFSLASGTLHIIPTAVMNSGTQHYYDEYFVNRLTKKDKTIKVKKVVANPSRFVPLDYEFSAKVTYRIGHWLGTLTPTYAIPLSPSTVTLPTKAYPNGRTFAEKLSSTFYAELDICHR